ncbi:hypothetical protein TNIN_325111 [Trichonephila inaurata madagascariensis]|uniref:Uncharacterized protein n=1 Tax=Trichonephila inaurata madagascariensis TaxID=2747483 RepID=A0A8X6XMQ5_9ARAC|nr:hypothetical protein TNIN_325111 [Trichonephila inaurata madagascariensis]
MEKKSEQKIDIGGNRHCCIKSFFLGQYFIRAKYRMTISGYQQTRQGLLQASVAILIFFSSAIAESFLRLQRRIVKELRTCLKGTKDCCFSQSEESAWDGKTCRLGKFLLLQQGYSCQEPERGLIWDWKKLKSCIFCSSQQVSTV